MQADDRPGRELLLSAAASPYSAGLPRSEAITAAERALRPRTALLVLAADLADLGIRSRLVDDTGALLRCWEGHRTGKVITVACRWGPDERLHFRYHPSGEELGDAEEILHPGHESGSARLIAVAFSARV